MASQTSSQDMGKSALIVLLATRPKTISKYRGGNPPPGPLIANISEVRIEPSEISVLA